MLVGFGLGQVILRESLLYVCSNKQQGAEIVREDLIDEILKESGPYQAPERIQTRAEMASSTPDTSTAQEHTIISPNE